MTAGDYSFKQKEYDKSLHFYRAAITKVIATKQEENYIRGKIAECNKKLGI